MIPHMSIIDPRSRGFVNSLVREFRGDVDKLLKDREEMRRDPRGIQAYVEMPSPAAMRDPLWKIAAVPTDLIDRRVEITGPAVDPKMAINALNSGACGYMVDGEDSMSPTWENVLRTQSTLTGIVRRSLCAESGGVVHTMNPKTAVLHYRPRGLHLYEKNWVVNEVAAPGCLVDVGLFMWWNAAEMLKSGCAPYLYLPKMETEHEARFWAHVLNWIEVTLNIPENCVRVTALIETVPGLIRAENIIWSLRTRLTGLNVGRWDYVLSLIKSMRGVEDYVLPDRSQITMDSIGLAEYARWVVRVAHRRGAHAIGGMAAQVPSRKDPVAAAVAIDAVRRDKMREVVAGHDGTWVAHPDLVSVVMLTFDAELKGQYEQKWNLPVGDRLDLDVVLSPMVGTRTMNGVRNVVRTVLVYMDAWLGGNGCVGMDGKMEDAATAEISRALLWQWVARGAELDDGTRVTVDLVDAVIRGEAAALCAAGTEPRAGVIDLLVRSIFLHEPPENIITEAYKELVCC
jgi:malate synthase